MPTNFNFFVTVNVYLWVNFDVDFAVDQKFNMNTDVINGRASSA